MSATSVGRCLRRIKSASPRTRWGSEGYGKQGRHAKARRFCKDASSVICGICGERMSIHYSIAHQQVVPTYVCQDASIRTADKVCQRVPGSVIDQAISNLLLELMQPMTLQVALAVQQEVEARVTETDALRRKQVGRAPYEG